MLKILGIMSLVEGSLVQGILIALICTTRRALSRYSSYCGSGVVKSWSLETLLFTYSANGKWKIVKRISCAVRTRLERTSRITKHSQVSRDVSRKERDTSDRIACRRMSHTRCKTREPQICKSDDQISGPCRQLFKIPGAPDKWGHSNILSILQTCRRM